MSQKDIKIKKLYDKGMVRLSDIARKIGYNDGNLNEGVQRVQRSLADQGVSLCYTRSDFTPSPSENESSKPDDSPRV